MSEKYPHPQGEELYENPQILQMIYALEWFDVPKSEHAYLVQYHPYLTKGDHMRLEQLNAEQLFTNVITFGLVSLISNRFLLGRK